jgi:dihydrofolate reductase
MRKVIASAFVSLDGVMQAPGGPEEDPVGGFRYGGWTVPYWEGDDVLGQQMGKLFDEPFDLLLGRKTYDIFAAYWPRVTDPNNPIAAQFNRVTKYVATSSPEPLTWQNSVALRGNVPAEIARLKKQEGPALLVQGSSQLLHSLFANDLVDNLTLLTFPVMLGRGKRVFDESSKPGSLKLVDSRVSTNGVVISTYERGGEVRTGSFA